MPEHLHLQHPRDMRARLGQGLAGYVRWLNARTGGAGSRLRRLPPPTWAAGKTKVRRDVRYIHLNPCRAGLCNDPLAWPWSTHRDRLGLVADSPLRSSADPIALHRYVSADPSCAVQGTDWLSPSPTPSIWELQAAVSEILRCPLSTTQTRHPARRLWILSARVLTALKEPEIAAVVGVSRSAVYRVPAQHTPQLTLLARIAGDPRFPGLR